MIDLPSYRSSAQLQPISAATSPTALVASHVLDPLVARATAALTLENGRALTRDARELDAADWQNLATAGSSPT
jgi:hypothetical protein